MTHTHPSRHRGRGFTLAEVLTITAVIVIILSIILPNFNRSAVAVRSARCASRQHQLHVAYATRAAAERNTPIAPAYWPNYLYPYVHESQEVFMCPEAGALSELVFLPDVGFPELQGYSVQTSSGYLIPFDGSNPRCAMVASSDTVYELKFEDWTDYDWDYVVQATRNPDNSITLCGYHPTVTVFYHEVLNASGEPAGVPRTRCQPFTSACLDPRCTDLPAAPIGELINSHFGMNGKADQFMKGQDGEKILLLDYAKLTANVIAPGGSDDWTVWRAQRHFGKVNTLRRDGSVTLEDAKDIDPSIAAQHDRLWRPTVRE